MFRSKIVFLFVAVMLLSVAPAQAASPSPGEGTPVSHEVMQRQLAVQTALGNVAPTLVVRGGSILNPYVGKWVPYQDIVIAGQRIAWVGPVGGWPGDYKTAQITDITGTYVVPAFVESHKHIESAHITPDGEAIVDLPTGTTAIFEAGHELGNALTTAQNAEFWTMHERAGSPLTILLQPGSAVPPTAYEHTMAVNDYATMMAAYADPLVAGLDEVMDSPAWQDPTNPGYDRLWGALQATWDSGRIVSGHGSGFTDFGNINAMAAAGLQNDHETKGGAEVWMKIQSGISILLRPASMPVVIPYLLRQGIIDWSHVATTTDDRSVEDAYKLGVMDYNVREAVKAGVPVEQAYAMGSLYPAQMWHVERDFGSVTAGRYADFIVLNGDPKDVSIGKVFAKGELWAENGKMVKDLPKVSWPGWVSGTMNIGKELTAADFAVKAPEGRSTVTAAILAPFWFAPTYMTATLSVKDGLAQSDPAQGIEKFCMVDRYNKLPQPVACMFWKDVGPKTPDTAVAATESHDNHNVHVDSNSDAAAALAVNELSKIGGGYVFVSGGKVIAEVPLEVGGLMSYRPPTEVAQDFTDFWKSLEGYEWLGGGIPTIIYQKFATLTCTPWKWVLVAPFTEPVDCPSGFVNVTTGECHAVVW